MSCFSCFAEIFPCCPASFFTVPKRKKSTPAQKYKVTDQVPEVKVTEPEVKEEKEEPDIIVDSSTPQLQSCPPSKDTVDGNFDDIFTSAKGEDGEIDAYELMDLLNDKFCVDFRFDGFSADLCRSMIAMRDIDMSGKLGIDESRDLWENLLSWKAYFTRYDVDGNGFFSGDEFSSILSDQDIELSPATKTVLSRRFSDKENRVWFPDYVACMVKMKSALELFDGKAKDDEDRMQLELDEFVQVSMYT